MPARTVRLDEVWRALDHCCPGHSRQSTDEYVRVTWCGKVYQKVPLGRHGKRFNSEVEAGHIRQLARLFGVTACFWGVVPEIFGNKKPQGA